VRGDHPGGRGIRGGGISATPARGISVILDAESLLSFFDRTRSNHWAIAGSIDLAADGERLVVSPFVIAQLEPLVRAQFGREGWLAVLDELAGGAWHIAVIDAAHLGAMRSVLDSAPDAVAADSCAEASVAVLTAS
jgi:hypothetical protein